MMTEYIKEYPAFTERTKIYDTYAHTRQNNIYTKRMRIL